jgi:hypothetical protein
MQKIQQRNSLNDLMQIRQNGKYSSTNLIRGSMINEMFVIFSEYLNNNDKKYLMNRVMADNIVHKNSFYSRENVWRIFDQRYLSCPSWVVQDIASSTSHGINSPDFLSLVYLYYTFRERMAFDIVTDLIWDNWKNKRTSLDSGAVQEYFISKENEVPTVKQWSETTVRKCAQSILASLRDFGILKGNVNKSIQRPSVALETAHHLLCILKAEGYDGNALITAKDWRLFLWNEVDVIDALNRMAMKQWIRFERSGPTTILELVHLPGERL